MEPIISVRGLGKRYNIAQRKVGYLTLRDSIAFALRHPLSFVTKIVSQARDRKKKTEDFWALKDVTFNVNKGEVLGIIGSNGAGKSTLLKLLSQITPPTTGEIVLRGKIGSLLEVGTGFHPELTGRENIYLNAAILGMRRKEIDEKFEQIVDFSEVGKFLETPVKYYSSGMYVRLAFAIAAHLDPDILILDEVLAVGDAAFQRKCFQKIQEITRTEGRTILFVSHNMQALMELCTRAILLEKGSLIKEGPTADIIKAYSEHREKRTVYEQPKNLKKDAYVTSCMMFGEKEVYREHFSIDDAICLKMNIQLNTVEHINVFLTVMDQQKRRIFTSEQQVETPQSRLPSTLEAKVQLPTGVIAPGTYSIQLSIQHPTLEKRVYDLVEEAQSFEISHTGTRFEHKPFDAGVIAPDAHWEVTNEHA